MRTPERALMMLRATPGVVTAEAMKRNGIGSPGNAVSWARMLTTDKIERVRGLGWRLER